MKHLLFITLLPIISFYGFSQEKNLSETIIAIAEELADDDDDPEAVSIYFERLQELAENPVKINSSSEEEISRLFFLSDFQVKAIIDYKNSSGKIQSSFELVNIPGFDREIVELIKLFISLETDLKMTSESVRWRNTLITNFSGKPSNRDTSFLGSSTKLLTKYKFVSGRISGGFTAEKDPGEKLFSGDPPLPDFLSAHIEYEGKGFIQKLIIGDYSASFGQGTNTNTGFRTGLSLSAPGYLSGRNEIRPYTSTDENNFFRGAAAEFTYKNLAIAAFFSDNLIDASLVSLSGTSIEHIENFYKSGLHTTYSLQIKKDAISDMAYGINLAYNFDNFRAGVTWTEDKLELPVIKPENDPETLYDFTGAVNSIYTLHYNSLIRRILLFGEVSVNESLKHAVIQGVTLRPYDRLTVNLLFREYDPGFVSFHGKGPSASSTNGNERGITGNFSFEAAKHLFISGGVDIYSYPWLRYRCSSPSHGVKKELRARFIHSEKLIIETFYNYRFAITDNAENNKIPGQMETITRSIKGSVRYSVYDYLTLATRIDLKVSRPSGSKGMNLSQDISCRFRKIPLSLWLRCCIYKTDDWNSRIYAYENDLLYSFSIPALSGEGSRSYIMVKWDISDSAEIRFKYGITSLTDNYLKNENKDELKLQFKIIF